MMRRTQGFITRLLPFVLLFGLLFAAASRQARAQSIFISFLTQSDGAQIFEYTTGGAKVVHGGPNGSWSLNPSGSLPYKLAFGPGGDLFVSGGQTGTVDRYDGATGALIATVAAGLSTPNGVAFDAADNMYVSESSANRVNKYAPIGGSYVLQASVVVPSATGLLVSGNALLVASALGDIRAINPTFTSSTLVAHVNDYATAVAVGYDGRYYASGWSGIYALDPLTQTGALWGATQPSGFYYNSQLVFTDNKLFVTSEQGVRVFDGLTGASLGAFTGLPHDRYNFGLTARITPSLVTPPDGVPEPGAWALLAGVTATAGLALARRRRK